MTDEKINGVDIKIIKRIDYINIYGQYITIELEERKNGENQEQS